MCGISIAQHYLGVTGIWLADLILSFYVMEWDLGHPFSSGSVPPPSLSSCFFGCATLASSCGWEAKFYSIQFCHAIVCQRNRSNLSSGLVVVFASNLLCSNCRVEWRFTYANMTLLLQVCSALPIGQLLVLILVVADLLLVFICDLCFSWLPLFSFQMNSWSKLIPQTSLSVH